MSDIRERASPPVPPTKAPPTQVPTAVSSQWGVHWRTPTIMAATFLLGIATATGHHLFYLSLDGTKMKDRRLAIQAGTAISYLVKALFAACIGVSHRQRVWSTLRNKPISIRGISALFEATVNPFTIFEIDTIFHAKTSTLMAILSWLLATAAIITPGSLSVHDKTFAFDQISSVPQINITDWNSFSSGNVFAKSLFAYEYIPSSDLFLYTGASLITKRLASVVAYGGNTAPITSPCGNNCSYVIKFEAPALSCQKAELQGARLVVRPYGTQTVLSYDVDGLLDPDPTGVEVCCINYNATLKPIDQNSTDGRLGLKNRISLISGTYLPQGPPRKLEDIQSVLCAPYSANYTLKISFTNGIPIYEILNLTLLSPLNEAILAVSGADVGTGSFNDIPARGLIDGLYDIFLGSIAYTQGYTKATILINSTSITSTELARATIPRDKNNALDWAPRLNFTGDLGLAVEELSHNLTISLLSITTETIPMTARVTQTGLAYTYNRFTLFVAYSAAATATLLCLLIGLHSLWSNGISSDVSFSRILVTTRSPTLDRLSENACLGGDPFPRNLLKTKLKFGELWRRVDEKGVTITHAGFGTEEEVVALRKGEKYL